MATQPVLKISEEEYLERDCANEFRSEYVDGEMVAMSGGSLRHSVIIARCVTQLSVLLAAKNCTVISSDMRVRAGKSYVYPDVSVVCGQPNVDKNKAYILTNPLLIVEVLSPSTGRFDQEIKFYLYREIDSSREYLLVETQSVNVKHFSRQQDNSWIFREYTGDAPAIFISSLNTSLPLGDLYRNVMDYPA